MPEEFRTWDDLVASLPERWVCENTIAWSAPHAGVPRTKFKYTHRRHPPKRKKRR